MAKRIQIADLLDPKKAEKHQPELTNYFDRGGTWQELLGYDLNTMAAQYKAAYDLYQAADFKKAASAFSFLTTLNPYEYTYWMGLAVCKQSDRFYEEAIVAYTVAEAIQPDYPLIHLHLAQCFYALQQRDKAIEHLKRTIEISGDRSEFKEVKQKAETLLHNLPS